MTVWLWVAGGLLIFVFGWFFLGVVQGLSRLRPQIRIASKKARQQKEAAIIENLDRDAVLFKAQQGDAAAQMKLGLMYATGRGIQKHDAKAFSWFERAAQAGVIDAQYSLGAAYEHGRGVLSDALKARFWYTQAALNGSATAQCNLGVFELRGVAAEPNWISAIDWFLKAAAQNNSEALANLDWVLRNRDTAPANTTTLIEQCRERAERGDPEACFLIGWCCENGFGCSERPRDAATWYERAQGLGHLYAHIALARLVSRLQ